MILTTESTNTLNETTDKLTDLVWQIVNWLSTSGVKLLLGLVVLFIAFKVINFLAKRVRKIMQKRDVDKTITSVTYSVIRKGLKLLLFVCLLGYVGIDTAAFASLFAAVGVGVSLATQGALSNFAGGLVILVTRPFKIGDYINAQGEGGTVEEIKVFYTVLKTPDNKVVMIPNGSLANGTIVNYSTKSQRRVDLVFSVSYNADFEIAKAIIRKVAEANELILKDPVPFIRVSEQADSSVNIACKLWTLNENYWDVYYYMVEEVKIAFDKEAIEIPFPQLDVNINNK